MHFGKFGCLVFTHAVAATLELPRQPIDTAIERATESITTTMRNDTVTPGQENSGLDLLRAVIIVKLDHGILEPRLESLQLLKLLVGF